MKKRTNHFQILFSSIAGNIGIFILTLFLLYNLDENYIRELNIYEGQGGAFSMYIVAFGIFTSLPLSILVSIIISYGYDNYNLFYFKLIYWIIYSIIYIEYALHEMTTLMHLKYLLIVLIYYFLIYAIVESFKGKSK